MGETVNGKGNPSLVQAARSAVAEIPRARWEYLRLEDEASGATGHDGLNRLGSEGWELVGVVPSIPGARAAVLVFKREVLGL